MRFVMGSSAASSKSQARGVWHEALQNATLEVFEALLGIRLEPAAQEYSLMEFTAMVGLAGDLRGAISVSCSKATAVEMTERMLQAEYTSEAQIWDALGEVCNVLAGRFKNGPPRITHNCVLSVPTVITGSNYIQHSLAGSNLKQCYRMRDQAVLITLAVHESPPGH